MAMIDKPDNEIYRALARLEGNTDFFHFMEYLKEREEQLTIELKNSVDNSNLNRLQGGCLVLDSVIETVNEARKVIRNSRLTSKVSTLS